MKDKKIVIRVNEEIKEQFDQLAKDIGVSSSSLGAIVIGGFIKSTLKAEETLKSSDVAIDTIKTLLSEGVLKGKE